MKAGKPSFIIIGAGGFIGSSFSAYLTGQGFEVFKIMRGQISGIESDFHLIAELLRYRNKHFTVVDFAYTSVPNSSFENPVKDYSENLYNVIRHIEFVKQLPNSSYIYISSGGTVYGNAKEQKPIQEIHLNMPLSPYGITKLACEHYVLMYKEVYNLDVKIVRPANIYGPGQKPFRGQGLVATAIAKVLQRQPIQVFGDGGQVRDYVYLNDFFTVLQDIVSYGTNGAIYNVGSGTGYSINQVLESIGNISGIEPVIEYLPSRPFDVRYNVLNPEKVNKLNNWKALTSLQDGLPETLNWIKNTWLNEK